MTDKPVRLVVAIAITAFTAIGIVMDDSPAVISSAVGLGVVLVIGVAAWRGPTGWPLVGTLALAMAGVTALGHHDSSNLSWMAFCAAVAWVALTSDLPVTIGFTVLLEAVLVLEWAFDPSEPGWMAWTVGTLFSAVAAGFARRLRVTVMRLRAAQTELATRTRAEERSRIAAEIHDLTGHALTVSLLHISGARLALDEDPDEAKRALDNAEDVTRQSLNEVRATVGLVRADAPGTVTPLPGAADIAELVESFRRVGAHVHLAVDDDAAPMGSAHGLAAYRVVQEALTNATKHAAGQPIEVSIGTAAGRTLLDIRNSTGSPNGPPTGSEPAVGAGLRGMRERVDALGGTLQAGPTPTGWRVTAEWPA